MNSPVMLWVILEEQRMHKTHPRAHHPVSRPIRRRSRFAVLRGRTATAVASLRRRLATPPATTRPVPGADVARLPVGCAA